MNARNIIAATVAAAALAVSGTAAASASARARVVTPARVTALPSCARELAAYRKVSGPREAGLRIGSTRTQAISDSGPATWARQLRAAGNPELAAAALGIHSAAADADFVMALTASAAADLAVLSGAGQAGICAPGDAQPAIAGARSLPGWFRWGSTSDRSDGRPCIVAWGGSGATRAEICADGKAFTR